MQRINIRTELIYFIREDISRSAISRACLNGTVQVVGGFSQIHPLPNPGWIVSITSIHGRTWLVAVTADDHNHIFHAWVTESIPWKNYVGIPDRGFYSIYDGDNPKQACLARERTK